MVAQAHLIVGIPINSLADGQKALQHFGVTDIPGDLDDLQEIVNDNDLSLTLEGTELHIDLIRDNEACDGDHFSILRKNTLTNELGDSYVCLGAAITSRYMPSILDAGWDRGGRPEPFILDLSRLHKILEEAQKQWPAAQMLMMDFTH
jgi:hypothetical protein